MILHSEYSSDVYLKEYIETQKNLVKYLFFIYFRKTDIRITSSSFTADITKYRLFILQLHLNRLLY